ncbi:CRTAC1 family protein [candidate division KSB1 bacterium]|nr:CRTAC1 family protein [candidate division KSB1 bacterium]
MRIYFEDFDNNGIMDIIEAYLDSKSNTWVPGRGLNDLANSLTFVKKRVPTHTKFASSTLEDIMGPDLELAAHLQANTFAHMLFINKGDHFEAKALPDEAQFAPAFYVGVSDFDGDGHDDVFLSQNFFATPKATSRLDAGRGLWLKGNGTGEFKSTPGQETGITVYGEQRGAALGDYDRDGRVDLVVTQNGGATKLYRNTGAKPGLRVRLIGPNGNPLGIGASIRIIYKNGPGPAREIHAGSGYWSQDSAVQIMGLREKPVGISVRWPGGKVTNSDLPKKVREITIDWKGNISVLD